MVNGESVQNKSRKGKAGRLVKNNLKVRTTGTAETGRIRIRLAVT